MAGSLDTALPSGASGAGKKPVAQHAAQLPRCAQNVTALPGRARRQRLKASIAPMTAIVTEMGCGTVAHSEKCRFPVCAVNVPSRDSYPSHCLPLIVKHKPGDAGCLCLRPEAQGLNHPETCDQKSKMPFHFGSGLLEFFRKRIFNTMSIGKRKLSQNSLPWS